MKKSVFLISFFLTIVSSAFAQYFYVPSESDIRRWKIADNVIPGKLYGMIYTDDNGMLQLSKYNLSKKLLINHATIYGLFLKKKENSTPT